MALSSIELCAGVGMLGEGVRAAFEFLGIKHRTVCYVEREAPAASQLAALMEAGALDPAPVWSDLLTFRGRDWRGKVDCVIAGFPCQDISIAGRRAGLDGKRSGLFFEILDIADACGAWLLSLENVSAIATATASVVDEEEGELEERAAARVVGELADRGWDAEWITLSASDVGASHGRARWFCFAWRRVGHAGLQHQHLQQRAHGSEHPGAGCAVAHSERSERWPQRSAGAGGQQGHDGGWREAHGGAGVAVKALGHSECARRPQAGCGPAQHAGREPEQGCRCVADASSARLPRGGAGCDATGWKEPHGHAGLEGGSLRTGTPFIFAPGPADTRWAGIIEQYPWLAPATEPGVRMLVDGMAYLVDESRSHQLRQVGNGVVPLCAAVAFVVLARRAGIFERE